MLCLCDIRHEGSDSFVKSVRPFLLSQNVRDVAADCRMMLWRKEGRGWVWEGWEEG